MFTYTIVVHTGNRAFAGSNDYIYLQLHGSRADSAETQINKSLLGFMPGSKRAFTIPCQESLGELVSVKLRSEKFVTKDEWFCDKIVVTMPDNKIILFPCYCWLGCDKQLILWSAKATLPFQDTHPNRRNEYLKRQKLEYRWKEYAAGVPQVIDAKTTWDLPAELRFSFTKNKDFYYNALKTGIYLKLKHLADDISSWESLNELQKETSRLISGNKTLEYVREHWEKDEFFGYQYLCGLNPMLIQRCSKLPEIFPVTEEMVKDSMGGSTLEKEMKSGNIFLADYKMLDELVGNVIHGNIQYLTAPLVLLYNNPNGKMLPIAIKLNQDPEEKLIFLPSDSKWDWMLAKTFVRAAEFGVHEVDFHLLRTHLLAEVFTVATLRNLPPPHPLYKLLFPHIRYTLQINIMARKNLISEDGAISKYAGVGGESLVEVLKRATSALTYSSLCLPDNIKERGLETVPNCYYRDDGLKLWNTINKYVDEFLKYYYQSDANVQKDTELRDWISEINQYGFLGKKGIPSSFQTLAELVKFVTMVIFTVSGQHAAVNNGQFEFGGWMPNYPTALRKAPPTEKGESTKCDFLETLPDVSTTVNGMAVLKLLSSKSSDHYPLGTFPEVLCDEEVPVKLIAEFKKDVKELSSIIQKRNKPLVLPYTYMDPKHVDNSVAI